MGSQTYAVRVADSPHSDKEGFIPCCSCSNQEGWRAARFIECCIFARARSCCFLPSFLSSQTETRLYPLPRSFVIKSLAGFSFGLEEVSLLCPVRALRIYLKRMKGLSRCSLALFLSPRCRTGTISKIAISFFLREVISGAGLVRGSEGQPLRAHSIRGISALAAFMRN